MRVLKSSAYLTPSKYDLGANNSAIHNTGGTTTSNVLTAGTFNTFDKSSEGIVYKTTEKRTIDGNKTTIEVTKFYYVGNSVNYDDIIKDESAASWKAISSNSSEIDNSVGQATSYLSSAHRSIQSLHGATYQVDMPMDYLHMLNCVCIYYVAKTKDCWDAGSYIEVPATRLTADSWSQIVTDIYNRPSPMKPYYYIHNVAGTGDFNDIYKVTSNGTFEASGNVTEDDSSKSNFSRTFKLNENIDASVVEKPIASRVGNASKVRCEIRYGKDDTLFQLAEVHVDYVKVPQHIRLTQEQIDLTEDTSQIMEFPDYVNQEIINELVHLVMARTNDPLLGNHI